MKQVSRTVEAPEDIGIAMIGVPPGSPVELELTFESVVEGVLVTGTANLTLAGQCARCLEAIERPLEIDLQELFCYPGKEADDAEASRIQDDLIDLEPLLRDQVVLELPFTPWCRPDCAGMCPTCGTSLNADPDHHHDEAVDPRWSNLAAWSDND